MFRHDWKYGEIGVMDYVFFRHGLLPLVVQLYSSILIRSNE
ncbi:hypothetical protein V144x_16440 [Gimesia aquarii]|uniref:Uncharacterized protein n=1 Tax=Gimesia aquarii TaxID=2527964 RepID=A0A517VT50_9PLAN|nr:hypothetical protein V144x_16440 [Gimesia aquarii]